MFTIQNTEGFAQSELDILNDAARIVRETYDCEGLEQYSLNDAIGNAWCFATQTAQHIADKVADRLKLSPKQF